MSGIELLFGAVLIVGHNVFRVLPNEVPILALAGLASFLWRNGSLRAMGFVRPASWSRAVGIAIAAAAVRIVVSVVAIEPLTSRVWPPAVAPEGASDITGNLTVALGWLALVWTWAAFGEEIGYRGYLLNRTADLGRHSTAALWLGVVVTAVLFGLGHYYKGPSGVVDSGFAGLVLGATYVLSGRNLWACVLAHGFIDTFGIAALYLGLDS